MDTGPDVVSTTQQKLLNLMVAADALSVELKREGRHVVALDVGECVDQLAFALTRYDQVNHDHD